MRTALLTLLVLGATLQSGELKVVRKVEPRFPPLATAARVQGRVRLSVTVTPDGRVEDARVLQGHSLLNEAAVETVRQWRFEATPLGVTGEVTVPFEFTPGHAVTGKVTDAAGRPLTGFRVAAIQHGYEDGQRVWKSANRTDPGALLQAPGENVTSPSQTDDRGVYRIFGLAPGEYYIRATYEAPSASPPGPNEVYAPKTFHPGTTDETAAVRVKVGAGGDAVADIVVPRVTTFNVSGRIVAPADAMPGPMFIVMNRLDARGTHEGYEHVQFGELTDKGEKPFAFHHVLPGTYEVVAHMGAAKTGYAYTYSERLVLEVNSKDVDDMKVVLRPTVDIKGRVVTSDPPFPYQTIRLEIRRRHPYIIGQRGTVALDGTFAIGGLPEGHYGFALTNTFTDHYVSDLRLGGQSIYAEGVIPVGTQPLPDLEVRLRPGGGSIEGTVRDSQRRGVLSDVMLVPEPSRRRNPMFYRSTRSVAGGSFRFSALPPGDYKVFAWEVAPPAGAIENAEFIAQIEQRGVPVTVRDGATSSIAVQEIPAP